MSPQSNMERRQFADSGCVVILHVILLKEDGFFSAFSAMISTDH
jgi:hypothetical protein